MQYLRDEAGGIMAGLLLGLVITVGISMSIPMIANQYYGLGGDGDDALSGATRDKVYQGKTIADMRAIATASTGYYLKTGRYAETLEELGASGYLDGFSPVDMWGNEWVYQTDGRHFVLVSLGADSKKGPKAPVPWAGDEYDPDLIVKDGEFLQMPLRTGPGSLTNGLEKGLERSKALIDKTENAISRR